jgi:hypothetical protein
VHVRMFEEKTLMEILVSRFCGIWMTYLSLRVSEFETE